MFCLWALQLAAHRQGKAAQKIARRQALAPGALQLRQAQNAAATGHDHAVRIGGQHLAGRGVVGLRLGVCLPDF